VASRPKDSREARSRLPSRCYDHRPSGAPRAVPQVASRFATSMEADPRHGGDLGRPVRRREVDERTHETSRGEPANVGLLPSVRGAGFCRPPACRSQQSGVRSQRYVAGEVDVVDVVLGRSLLCAVRSSGQDDNAHTGSPCAPAQLRQQSLLHVPWTDTRLDVDQERGSHPSAAVRSTIASPLSRAEVDSPTCREAHASPGAPARAEPPR